MSIEPKPHSNLQKRSIDKPFTSPDKNLKCSRGSSSSPRYRSPIHTRLNPENPEPVSCPTCEKRSSDLPPVQYHESPPKIRPSHHNIVCEDCSEGSFSQVLKVVCLNQELPTGTQKIKIIESVPQPLTSSSFPVVGSGKSMQVMYQEVYPPPKPELTSLIPESCRENGTLNYQMKEEERKRVAIRRAEYANRIKGVSKTIVANVSPNGDRLSRAQRTSVDLERKDLMDKEMNLCKSEQKKLKSEEVEENFADFSFNKKNCYGNKEGEVPAEGKNRAGKAKAGKKDQVVKKDQKPDVNKVSYFQKLHEHAKKDSLDASKLSVKQKILAKLAGKDFAHFLKNEEKDGFGDKDEGLKVKDEDYEDVENQEKDDDENFEENDEKLEDYDENLEDNIENAEIIEDIFESQEDKFENLKENAENLEENVYNPEDNVENHEGKSESLEYSFENSDKKAEKISDSENSTTKTLNTKCNPVESGQVLSNQNIFKQIMLRKNESRELGDIDHTELGINKNLDGITSIPDKSLSNTTKGKLNEETKNSSDSPSSLRKTIKSGANTDRSQENPENSDQTLPGTLNDHTKTAKFLETFNMESLDSNESKHIDEIILLQHKRTFGDLVKGESSDDCPVFERELTLELNPDNENSHTIESFTLNTKLVSELKNPKAQMEKIDSEGTEKFPNSDETRQMSLAGPQDYQETPPKDSKPYEAQEKKAKACEGEEKISPEQFNKLFLVLTDPKVIKGLRLLGGFADYLEKNGKDVLDWKF